MKINLEDSVKIVNLEALKAEVPLDDEQIGWVKDAYKKIEKYIGQEIKLNQINKTFSKIGEDEEFRESYFREQFKGKLLSLKKVNLSKENKTSLEKFKKEGGWRPVVGDKRSYLVADEAVPNLYFGIASPTEIDGEPGFTINDMARIVYSQ